MTILANISWQELEFPPVYRGAVSEWIMRAQEVGLDIRLNRESSLTRAPHLS